MNTKTIAPSKAIPWAIQDRTLEIETIAALYRELQVYRRFSPAEHLGESKQPQFSFERWLENLLEEVRASLGALSVGLGFIVYPRLKQLGRVMVVRRNGVRTDVALDPHYPIPTSMPSKTNPILSEPENHSPYTTAWWGVTTGEPPDYGYIAIFVELPSGDFQRQRRLVEVAAIAVWSTIRDVLFEYIQPELWQKAGLDPYRLFRVEEKSAAYLFADIRGFTGVVDMITWHAQLGNTSQLPTVHRLINEYAQEMQSAVSGYGRIDKFMGDGILAVFGDTTPEESPVAACQAAVSAAINMLQKFTELEQRWKEEWIEDFLRGRDERIELRLGIGISYGLASFTFISTVASRHYTPVGSHVNLAQRLEQATGVPRQGDRLCGSMLASATVQRHTGNQLGDGTRVKWVRAELTQPKGIPYRLEAFWATPDKGRRTSRAQRAKPTKRQQTEWQPIDEETALIQAAKVRLPVADERQFKRLIVKSERGTLTPKELDEYRTLAQRVEQLNATRVEALAELVRLRGKPVRVIMEEIGWERGADGT